MYHGKTQCGISIANMTYKPMKEVDRKDFFKICQWGNSYQQGGEEKGTTSDTSISLNTYGRQQNSVYNL